MKKFLALLLAVIMLFSLAACGETKIESNKITTAPTETQPKETQPEETVPTEPLPVEGNEVGKLCYGADLPIVTAQRETEETINPQTTGKVTVINFWGTWCGPCVSELPHLSALASNYSDTLTVIAVHSLEGYKKMPAYIGKNYADSDIIFSWETTGEYVGDYYLKLGGGQGYPYTVVLDANGVITATKLGMMSYEDMVSMVENAGAVENEIIIPEISVSDAYSYSYEYSAPWLSGEPIIKCYHLPQLNLPDGKADTLNSTIYGDLYPLIEAVENRNEDSYELINGMLYTCGQNGDVISVVVRVEEFFNNFMKFHVYNVSATTGENLSDAQVYEALGMTEEEGREVLFSYVQAYWETVQPSEMVSLDYIDSMTADSLTVDYLDAARPFVSTEGKLMFVAKIAAPAGAGFTYCILDETGAIYSLSCTLPEHQNN